MPWGKTRIPLARSWVGAPDSSHGAKREMAGKGGDCWDIGPENCSAGGTTNASSRSLERGVFIRKGCSVGEGGHQPTMHCDPNLIWELPLAFQEGCRALKDLRCLPILYGCVWQCQLQNCRKSATSIAPFTVAQMHHGYKPAATHVCPPSLLHTPPGCDPLAGISTGGHRKQSGTLDAHGLIKYTFWKGMDVQ